MFDILQFLITFAAGCAAGAWWYRANLKTKKGQEKIERWAAEIRAAGDAAEKRIDDYRNRH